MGSRIFKQSLDCFKILDFVGIVSAITKLENNKNLRNKIVKHFITSKDFKILDTSLRVLGIELIASFCDFKKKDALKEHLVIKGRNR